MSAFPSKEEMQKALADRHGAELQKKFSAASVAVCGLGGLGSNIAVALARAGVGRLHLIDFDRVDITNLNRQQYAAYQIGKYKTDALKYNLLQIAPYCEITVHATRIAENNISSLLKDEDIICEAFDRAEEKAMLVNGVMEIFPDKYIISGSGMAGLGSGNTIKTRRVTSRFYICGDEVSACGDGLGLISSRVMICAAHQANTVLRILAQQYEA